MRRRGHRNTKQDLLQIKTDAKRADYLILLRFCELLLVSKLMTITKISHTIWGVENRMMISR